MTLIILMQRPKQEGLGAAFGGGVTDQVFGARTTNVLQRGTVYLGSLFFILSLVLAILVGQQNRAITVVKKEDMAKKEAPKTPEAPNLLTTEIPVKAGEASAPIAIPPTATTPVPAPAPESAPAPAPSTPETPKAPTTPEPPKAPENK